MGMLVDLVLGRRRRRAMHLDAPPRTASLKPVRPRGAETVRARLAGQDGEIRTSRGVLSYRAGEHYLVRYENGDEAAVLKRVFERTYKPLGDGRYEKRTDLVLHYFTLPYDVIVETLEGPRQARAGDWIVRGVLGELYPVPAEAAHEKYAPI